MTFARSWTLGLEAQTRCKKCHFILPLNGAVTFVACAKCGERRELTRDAWDDVLTMPAKLSRVMREGTTKSCQVGVDSDALIMKATREAPRCAGCHATFDPARAPEACSACGKSLAMKDAPALLKNTHRSLQRTFLGASEGATSDTASRWYLWFSIEPDEVDADRKLAEAAVKRVSAKLPNVPRFDAPKQSLVVAEDESPMIAGSSYREAPRRELFGPESPMPVASDTKDPTMPRNLALILIVLAGALGFLLGRLL